MVNYTDEQRAPIAAAPSMGPGSSSKIFALAGSGKTTTLRGVSDGLTGVTACLSFNKEIAKDTQVKFKGTSTKVSTMHSLAYRAVKDLMQEPPISALSAREVMESKAFKGIKFPRTRGYSEFRLALGVIRTMGHFAHSDALQFLPTHGELAIIDAEGDPALMERGLKKKNTQEALDRLGPFLAKAAREVWVGMERDGRFTHDMYLKRLLWSKPTRERAFAEFGSLMVDEAQDLNPVQTAILRETGLPLVCVGDTYQQIYSWRGAQNALMTIPGQSFYLTQSFRFSETIAAPVRRVLASRPDGGPKERLIGAGTGNGGGHTGVPWAIICRTNMGVVDAALDFLEEGYPIQIDNIDGLLRDLRSAEALFLGDMSKVLTPELKVYADWDELKAESEEGNQTLKKIVQLVERKRVKAVAALAALQTRTQKDSFPQVFLCTAHRSKGLEFPRVTLGKDWKPLSQMQARYHKALPGPQRTSALEEWNALYVACSRAMVSLEGLDELLSE